MVTIGDEWFKPWQKDIAAMKNQIVMNWRLQSVTSDGMCLKQLESRMEALESGMARTQEDIASMKNQSREDMAA